MRAQCDIALAITGGYTKNIPYIIRTHIIQRQIAKALRQPGRTRRLPERGAGIRATSTCQCANCGSCDRNQLYADRTSGAAAKRATSCCTVGNKSDTSACGINAMDDLVILQRAAE